MNILFVYYNSQYPLRPTLAASLDAFGLYSGHRVFMWNAAFRRRLGLLSQVRFDLVIFSTLFLSQHWGGAEHFSRMARRVSDVKRLDAVKVALPQDEFYCPDLYSEFFNEFRIDVIYSVSPEETWPLIYRRLTYKPRFHRVLTGYIDERKAYQYPLAGRHTDIGYRTIGVPTPTYGTFGYRKWIIAARFLDASRGRQLVVDISTNDRDKLVGNAWYDFLAGCKYVLGVESGTSVVDHDGSLTRSTRAFLQDHPEASFEAVAQACLTGADGKILIRAIGPRHFEACLTGTCQILVEGDYNGILRPWEHYIPLKHDFSNIEEVLDLVERDDMRGRIVGNAWRDIVASGRYTHRSLVNYVLETAMEGRQPKGKPALRRWGEELAFRWNQAIESVGWMTTRFVAVPVRGIVAMLKPALERLPTLMRALQFVRARLR